LEKKMKQLLLLRHAQAEAKPPLADDFDRVLSPAGRAEASEVGRYLQAEALTPDHAVVSGAKRALETWRIVAGMLMQRASETIDDSLYSVAPAGLLFEVCHLPETAGSCLVIAHNPTMHAIANVLTGVSSDRAAIKQLKRDMPPATLAVLTFAVTRWQDVAPGSGQLAAFLTPEQIAGSLENR